MSMRNLLQDVEDVIAEYEGVIGTSASRTRQMIERYGVVEALSRLMVSADLQSGFKKLRDQKKLKKTFEAVVVRHAGQFRADVVAAGKWRLENPYHLEKGGMQ